VELSGRENLQPEGEDWDPAREFFERRQVRRADLGGAGDWMGWSELIFYSKAFIFWLLIY
jgi:hypothetical protein